MTKNVLVLIFSLVFIFSYYLFKQNVFKVKNQTGQENINVFKVKNQTGQENIKEENKVETLEERACRTGSATGRRNMLIQMGLEESEVEDKFVSRVSDLETTEEDQERLKEIYMKAYVDAYHKAGETINCPKDH